jgi:hypothetical protein
VDFYCLVFFAIFCEAMICPLPASEGEHLKMVIVLAIFTLYQSLELTSHLPEVIACGEDLELASGERFQPAEGFIYFLRQGQVTLAVDDEQNLLGIVIENMPLGCWSTIVRRPDSSTAARKLPLAKLPPAILNVFFIIRRRST